MGVKELIRWRQEIGLSETLDWSDLLSPRWVNAPGCSLSDYQRAVSERLRADIDAVEQGNKVGPLKTALDTLRDLRNEIRACVQYGRISGRSYATELMDRYSPNNAFLSIGPPVERIKQLKALVDTGVVTILPAESSIDLLEGKGAYSYFAPTIPDSQGWATVLIEARLPSGAIHRTADPLLGDLLSGASSSPTFTPRQVGSRGLSMSTRRLLSPINRALIKIPDCFSLMAFLLKGSNGELRRQSGHSSIP